MCSVISNIARIRTAVITSVFCTVLLALVTTSSSAASSIQLAWDASTDSGIVGYYVYYGPASGNYTNATFVGNVTNATITGLVPGGTYYFAATSTNNIGLESLFSNETSATLGTPNLAPTLNAIANVTINENAGAQSVSLAGITSGSASEVQTLTIAASSGNPSLIPNPTVTYTSPNTSGTLSFTPVANTYGSAVVTVTVNDGGATNSTLTRTFTVTVAPVNQAPTLLSLGDINLTENAGLQTVGLAGISSGAANENQTLTVTASSGNPSLIPNPTVSYTSPNTTGSLAFTPAANAAGTAVITVNVNDGGSSNNIVSRTFTVTVAPVNQAPTLAALNNVTINESVGLQTVSLSGISSGAANESQTLTVTASSGNTGLIPNPTVNYTSPNTTGSITFTPLAGAYGTAVITVNVNDGGASNNVVSRTFTVTVAPVNQAPTLAALSNVTVNQNAGLRTVNLSGISSGATNENQTLTVTAASSSTGVIPTPAVSYTSPNATGSISFTPVANATGSSTITVTVNDGGASNNVVSRTFSVTINQLPTLSAFTNLVLAADSSPPPLSFTIGDAETAAGSLVVSASSSNASVVTSGGLVLAGTGANRTLQVTPAAGQTGTTTITVSVNDGLATTTRSFQLSVQQRPTAPGNVRVFAQN